MSNACAGLIFFHIVVFHYIKFSPTCQHTGLEGGMKLEVGLNFHMHAIKFRPTCQHTGWRWDDFLHIQLEGGGRICM